jgi:hypothetical protein
LRSRRPTSAPRAPRDSTRGGTDIDPLSILDLDLYEECWVGTHDVVDGAPLDQIIDTLSHEIVEASTDPYSDGIQATPGFTFPNPGPNTSQICDYEAANHAARVNGVLVQSYWSSTDGAFIVPGQTTNFFVDVNGQLSFNDFTTNDTITLSAQGYDATGMPTSDPTKAVTNYELIRENGESTAFYISTKASVSDLPLTPITSVVVNASGANVLGTSGPLNITGPSATIRSPLAVTPHTRMERSPTSMARSVSPTPRRPRRSTSTTPQIPPGGRGP